MSTVVQVLTPEDAAYPAANYPQFKVVAGTNFPVSSLAFDAATEEAAYFKFRAVRYGSGNVTANIFWYADTASSGDVVFGGSLAAITPNTDTQDIETKAFATEVTATDTHLGTTGQRLHSIAIAISNLDSIAADDWCYLKLARKAAAGGDTMTGDALVVSVSLEYSDV
jgi:hypothetical protein